MVALLVMWENQDQDPFIIIITVMTMLLHSALLIIIIMVYAFLNVLEKVYDKKHANVCISTFLPQKKYTHKYVCFGRGWHNVLTYCMYVMLHLTILQFAF